MSTSKLLGSPYRFTQASEAHSASPRHSEAKAKQEAARAKTGAPSSQVSLTSSAAAEESARKA